MRIHRDIRYLDPADRGATAAIGNFDGVHLGHQAILKVAASAAKAPFGVVTFEPHPREYFSKSDEPFRLMNADAKASRLAKLGVDHLFEVAFKEALAELSPKEFAQHILVDRLGLAHVTVGSDFRFGKDRAGDGDMLKALGEDLGFGVTVSELIETNGIEVSSTRIRQALSDGRPEDAAAMLGHWHRIEGVVVRGDQRGRELGYPTANMMITGLHRPKFGVYAVKVSVLSGENVGDYDGVASLGIRPMFDGDVPNLETYVFDFKGDLYGAQLSVALVGYLRPEEKFESLDELIAQMDADSARAREILA
ncbi:MAG: bifunctional riboflavin kinase/FAD synthetase [Boseongicola sp.]|nr:bifunctional riboflavin kinase/FAD synthetase [Boseongicola sp.]MDD9977341.1 bifunctional riboflavin kinase/FAD synthetase [Boseongicola sp.]